MDLPEEPPPTPRNVAKYVTRSFISIQVSSMSRNAISNHTSANRDATSVKIVSGVIGWYVSYKLTPLTDKMVDKVADFIVAKRAEWKAKKEAKKIETSEDQK